MKRLVLILLHGIWMSASLLSVPAGAQASPPSNGPAPIELKISGPGLIRTGQEVRFKVVVINHSDRPIIIADRSTGSELSNFLWNVVDARGNGVPTAPVHPGTFRIDTMSGSLTDEVIHVLEPGKKLIYKLASDPTVASCAPSLGKMECMEKRVFPGKAAYRIWLHYRFAPVGEADYTDMQIKTQTLTNGNIEVLRITPAVDITSNDWIVRLE